ncbi:piggyBac transposable element-derived protein 3-like [Uloborus diversus]|uniref:piggyBac transposable element-derived protein 3-like n=1 Tax=Uloborus diversus TaxID=327109 RepID=UPI002408FD48|nr:piggyBac transposable element-derived protein 3-like [Uloborus diversus]
MSRSQYKTMKQNLHLADNTAIDNNDKLYKVRPYLNLLNKKFQQFGVFSHNLSIDEQMIPYRGKHSAKMFLKGKPIRFGYESWTLASSDGYVFNFDIYTGKSTTANSSEYEKFGLGGSVVMNLLKVIETPINHDIYFDNFFTSFPLLCHLKYLGFNATGTMRKNRIDNCLSGISKVY